MHQNFNYQIDDVIKIEKLFVNLNSDDVINTHALRHDVTTSGVWILKSKRSFNDLSSRKQNRAQIALTSRSSIKLSSSIQVQSTGLELQGQLGKMRPLRWLSIKSSTFARLLDKHILDASSVKISIITSTKKFILFILFLTYLYIKYEKTNNEKLEWFCSFDTC